MSKKITGVYKDNQGFEHVVIYFRKDEPYPYAKLIYNPQGQYCSHAHYDKEGIKMQISGMKKTGG